MSCQETGVFVSVSAQGLAPNAPEAPNYTIDYKKEILKIRKGYSYSADNGITFVTAEDGGIVLDVSESITNGTPIYIQKAATTLRPASNVQILTPAVHQKHFTIISEEPQTYSEAVAIGKQIGQTRLGVFTKTHIYKRGPDKKVGVSNKIFIELRKPKGNITVDDNGETKELLDVLADMSEERPVHEPRTFADIPDEQLEHEAPPPSCECWDGEPCHCA